MERARNYLCAENVALTEKKEDKTIMFKENNTKQEDTIKELVKQKEQKSVKRMIIDVLGEDFQDREYVNEITNKEDEEK